MGILSRKPDFGGGIPWLRHDADSRVGDQAGSTRRCLLVDVYSLNAITYGPLLYVYIYLAYSDTWICLYSCKGYGALDHCPVMIYGERNRMSTTMLICA